MRNCKIQSLYESLVLLGKKIWFQKYLKIMINKFIWFHMHFLFGFVYNLPEVNICNKQGEGHIW